MYLQLFKNNIELLGSDGVMYVDGRYSVHSIINKVKDRNKTYAVNFPHKVCDSFGVLVKLNRDKVKRVIKL